MPSSTSSSESASRLPWAGIVATLLVVLGDPFLVRSLPWTDLAEDIAEEKNMEFGVAQDLVMLEELRGLDEAGGPRVMFCGNSRAARFLRVMYYSDTDIAGATFHRFTHAGMEPFEQRALADTLVAHEPDAVVVGISEFDTHRPLRLSSVTGAGSLGAVADLVALTGAAFAHEQRDALMQLALAAWLPSYRYREVLRAAGLGMLEQFPGPTTGTVSIEDTPFTLAGEDPLPVKWKSYIESLRAALPGANARVVRAEAKQVISITRGPHVAVQQGLLRAMIETYRDAECAVLVVEPPLHPEAAVLYRSEIVEEARAFLRELDGLPGVDVLWLSESGPFAPDDFTDLTHLDEDASRRVAERVAERLTEMLSDA